MWCRLQSNLQSDGPRRCLCDENDHGYSAGKDARAADDSGHTESNVNQNTVIVQTGDEMSILAWSSIAMISLAGMILMFFKKKEKQ